MKKDLLIPKRENKTKRLFLPITPTEQKEITDFCKKNQIKMSDFVRFAIRNTYEIL